jgi:hypothetical protein
VIPLVIPFVLRKVKSEGTLGRHRDAHQRSQNAP